MAIDIAIILEGLKNGISSIIGLKGNREKRQALRYDILNEQEKNMYILLNHYKGKGAKMDKVIDALKFDKLEEGLRTGFNFRKIKKGKIDPSILSVGDEKKLLSNFDTKQLAELIKSKIEELKIIKQMYYSGRGWDRKRINPEEEIEKLVRLYSILGEHLKN